MWWLRLAGESNFESKEHVHSGGEILPATWLFPETNVLGRLEKERTKYRTQIHQVIHRCASLAFTVDPVERFVWAVIQFRDVLS
jgi:sorbitol-specific phosphotransferase system component IIC